MKRCDEDSRIEFSTYTGDHEVGIASQLFQKAQIGVRSKDRPDTHGAKLRCLSLRTDKNCKVECVSERMRQ